jgi:hypothetical protein
MQLTMATLDFDLNLGTALRNNRYRRAPPPLTSEASSIGN